MFYDMDETEKFQPAMGNPPWKDFSRYIRNSPIYYVDRVKTPLLMIHADLDSISMTQAEEFFASLYRQGKTAELVRYWGESHVIGSPSNVRDQWSRIFAWLDEYGDIARDAQGSLLFDGDCPSSRKAAAPLTPQDFLRFDSQ
jgi:dipeptidyl aminopeptidase/acylaminoacyl peptidase